MWADSWAGNDHQDTLGEDEEHGTEERIDGHAGGEPHALQQARPEEGRPARHASPNAQQLPAPNWPVARRGNRSVTFVTAFFTWRHGASG